MRDRLFAAYPELTGLSDLLTAVRSTRVLPREGRSTTGIDYSFHGAGCRMTDEQRIKVDVDLVDGIEAFDDWRVHAFLAALVRALILAVEPEVRKGALNRS
ncbi:DUF6896 domain-containing protein [Micromonospora sp. LOL_024]|uniref:DUF6896 domain-containing protein n=1 Tax=Micromonospora sp. LOL_024 TaxID=3345412 RepID=UPI003A8A4333